MCKVGFCEFYRVKWHDMRHSHWLTLILCVMGVKSQQLRPLRGPQNLKRFKPGSTCRQFYAKDCRSELGVIHSSKKDQLPCGVDPNICFYEASGSDQRSR